MPASRAREEDRHAACAAIAHDRLQRTAGRSMVLAGEHVARRRDRDVVDAVERVPRRRVDVAEALECSGVHDGGTHFALCAYRNPTRPALAFGRCQSLVPPERGAAL
ncbi:MAG TPA: hypothetical protein VM600_10615 [Actinomycetota bacterium]|nr:hypothetical protein [Actinomycetota bacterium]